MSESEEVGKWKYDGAQQLCLQLLRERKDLFFIGPTACGKTRTVRLAAKEMDDEGVNKFILELVPLLTLVEDIAKKAAEENIKVQILTGDMRLTEEQWSTTTGLVIATPEKIIEDLDTQGAIEAQMKAGRVAFIHIDEAHYVKNWVYFRPSYGQLGLIKGFSAKVPIMCTSATLPPSHIEEIAKSLRMNPSIVRLSVNRKNLRFNVCSDKLTKEQKIDKILAFSLQTGGGRMIVFCGTAHAAHSNWKLMQKRGVKCGVFFGGVKYTILFTTSVVGVGVDTKDIKQVVHLSMPANIEDYFQQVGRAARNDEETIGHCLLFFSWLDVYRWFFNFQGFDCRSLWKMVLYCLSLRCRRQFLLEHFGEVDDEHKCEGCPPVKAPPMKVMTYGQLQAVCSEVLLSDKVKLSQLPSIIRRSVPCSTQESYILMSCLMFLGVFQVSAGKYLVFSGGYCSQF